MTFLSSSGVFVALPAPPMVSLVGYSANSFRRLRWHMLPFVLILAIPAGYLPQCLRLSLHPQVFRSCLRTWDENIESSHVLSARIHGNVADYGALQEIVANSAVTSRARVANLRQVLGIGQQ